MSRKKRRHDSAASAAAAAEASASDAARETREPATDDAAPAPDPIGPGPESLASATAPPSFTFPSPPPASPAWTAPAPVEPAADAADEPVADDSGAKEPKDAVPPGMGPEFEPVELDALAPEVEAPRGERRRGPRFNFFTGTLLLAAVALFGGYLAVNLILMPSLTRQGAEVRVPEVTGFSEREAERMLAAEDLKLSKISEQWSPDVPRGFITAQDPPAGGVVKRGRRISVIVSLGAQGTSVPILEGVGERQAEILLEGAGLKLGRSARAYSEQVSKDQIIASDPPGETVVEQETAVDLLVSLGPPPRSFVLPDLSGRDASTAARDLRDAGFSVSLREGGPRQKSGLVAGQDPPSGARVAPRDSIVLYYHP